MDKTPEKTTKDPRRVEAAGKGRENYMNKLKESILNDAKKGSRGTSTETPSATNTATTPANGATSSANSATNTATTSTNSTTNTTTSDTYIYGTGILTVLAIGVCAFGDGILGIE